MHIFQKVHISPDPFESLHNTCTYSKMCTYHHILSKICTIRAYLSQSCTYHFFIIICTITYFRMCTPTIFMYTLIIFVKHIQDSLYPLHSNTHYIHYILHKTFLELFNTSKFFLMNEVERLRKAFARRCWCSFGYPCLLPSNSAPTLLTLILRVLHIEFQGRRNLLIVQKNCKPAQPPPKSLLL